MTLFNKTFVVVVFVAALHSFVTLFSAVLRSVYVIVFQDRKVLVTVIKDYITAEQVLYWFQRIVFWLADILSNLVQGMVVVVSLVAHDADYDILLCGDWRWCCFGSQVDECGVECLSQIRYYKRDALCGDESFYSAVAKYFYNLVADAHPNSGGICNDDPKRAVSETLECVFSWPRRYFLFLRIFNCRRFGVLIGAHTLFDIPFPALRPLCHILVWFLNQTQQTFLSKVEVFL